MQVKKQYLSAGHENRPGTKITVKGVVVHWTANENKGADAEANRNYFNRGSRVIKGELYELYNDKNGKPVPFRSASAHLCVDDNDLVECLPWKKGEAEKAYHVGADSYVQQTLKELGGTSPNSCTIGLEICVNADGNFKKAYQNAIEVTAQMLKEHGLGIDRLYRHYDVTRKLCPGFHTQATYSKKYLSTTDYSKAWSDFKAAVAAVLNPKKPDYYKVYINGGLYKYQFTTSEGAEGCAKDLFRQSGGKNTTIYATDPKGNTIYTPSKHPEDFPEFAPKPAPPPKPTTPYWRVFKGGVQQGAFSTGDNAVVFAKDLYRKTKDASIIVKNPDGSAYYTPSKHPEDF